MNIRHIRLPIGQMLTVGLLPSFLKRAYYRSKGYRIGRNVSFGPGSVIAVSESVDIEDDVKFGLFAVIAGETLKIGRRTNIRSFTVTIVPHIEFGADVIMSETAIIRAQLPFPDSRITVGDRAHLYPFSIIDASRPVTIGEETGVGFSVYIFTHGAYKSKLDGYPVTLGEVKIGRCVYITCRVFIMPGVELGDDVVIGTGSVITRSFPDGSVVIGAPAKLVKDRDDFVEHYSDDEKMGFLRSMIDDFAQFAEHFTDATVDRKGNGSFLMRSDGKTRRVEVQEHGAAFSKPTEGSIHIALGPVSEEQRATIEAAGAMWFSDADHQCAGELDAAGEEFREFLTRYGLYFERLG